MKKQITFKQLKRLVKESMEPFGDFDYPEWMDDVEYHKGQKPDVAQVLKDLGWSVAVDDEKIRATPPSWGIDITFHEGDKVMEVIGDAYSLVKRTMEKSADAYYLGQAFEEIKGAVEMTMHSPLDEAKKVKSPRYTIQQYCDMKGLDADKLMAAMKAHWSILSPPITDRTTFPEPALDTYAERYADEMNADTSIEVQADEVYESDESEIDLQFSNQVLKRMEKLIDQGKDQLGNLERNPRKIPVTAAYRLEITETMKEIRRLAHLIVDQMKD